MSSRVIVATIIHRFRNTRSIIHWTLPSHNPGHRRPGGDADKLTLPYSGKALPLAEGKHTVTSGAYAPIGMSGRDVYKFAMREVPRVLEEALTNAGR